MNTIEEVNQHKNDTLAKLVDNVPQMTALELKTFKNLIKRGDWSPDIEVHTAVMASTIGKFYWKVFKRLDRKKK